MALRRAGDKPLPESVMIYFTDAHVRHQAVMDLVLLELIDNMMKNGYLH